MAGGKKLSELQDKLNSETEKYRGLQNELQKCVQAAQQLEAQLKENEVVKEELTFVKDNSRIFKLIGPVLVKQDLAEARANVDKRLDYITGEIKRNDALLGDLKKKQGGQKETVDKLQRSMMELAQQHQQQQSVK